MSKDDWKWEKTDWYQTVCYFDIYLTAFVVCFSKNKNWEHLGTKACTGVQSEEPHFDFSRNEWMEASAFVAILNLGLASECGCDKSNIDSPD